MQNLNVGGMSCSHCVQAVTKAIEAVPQAGAVTVDLKAGTVSVTGPAEPAALRQAIELAGFEVIDAA